MTDFENGLCLGYCAALMDGEGMFSIGKSKGSYTLLSRISMTFEETVNKFHDLIKVGEVNFRPNTKSNYKDSYIWECHLHDATFVAKLLLPHLTAKRRQAELLIEFDSKWRRRKRGEELSFEEATDLHIIFQLMKEANMRGKVVI